MGPQRMLGKITGLIGPLAPILSYRTIHASGFNASDSARDVIGRMSGGWPNEWITKCQALSSVPIPSIRSSEGDTIRWKDLNANMQDFSVSVAWKSLQEIGMASPRYKIIWTKGFIPKYAFCLWLACFKRLPMQDRIRIWKQDPPDMKCPLCNTREDSHDHLFFGCGYSAMVWQQVQADVGLQGFPSVWNEIILEMDCGKPSKAMHRIALSAAVYVIWQERNKRIFTNQKRSETEVALDIRNTVLQRMAWKNRNKAMGHS